MPAVSPDCDLCVIGGGDAGFAMAQAGVALGLKVALVDPGTGEPCWRNWEVTLTVLRRAAQRTASRAGADAFRAFQLDLRLALEAAAPDRRFARLAAMNIRMIKGRARFRDADHIIVGDQAVRARRFVLATGVKPASTAPSGACHASMVECLGARDAPAHFMALGGDERSVALALGLRRLGLGSILQAADGLLPGYDPELVAPLRRTLLELGVTLLEGKPGHGERPAPSPDLIYVPAAAAALADLDCDAAGVELRGGALQLSPALRTTNPRVYAIGGVAGARSSQAAQAQVGVVLRSAFFRIPASYEAAQVPRCVETCPGLAAVGLDEPAARLLGPITTWRWPLAETPAGAARGLAHGFVKVVADRRGVMLGAGVVGPEAAEQIGLWTMALRARLTLSDVATLPLPSPSLAEASRRAASQYLAHRLRSPWTKRALSLLTWLG